MESTHTEPIRGRCLCGAVQFRLRPPTDFSAHCHCHSCRLAHGAPFVTWTSVPVDRFELDCPEDAVRWYRSSEWILWGSCRTCGSSMLYRADRAGHPESPRLDRIYVTVASLIDPLDREPDAHVSYEEHVPWLRLTDGLPKHRGKTGETVPD